MKPPLVEVVWTDAQDVNESATLDRVPEVALLATRTTCGYLVAELEDRVVLAHDYDAEQTPPEVGNFTVIPKGWVKKIVRRSRRAKKAE